MIPDKNYFNTYLDNFQSNIKSYESIIDKVKDNSINADTIAELQNLDNKIEHNLDEMTWLINTINVEDDRQILIAANDSFAELGGQLGHIKEILTSKTALASDQEKMLLDNEVQKINDLFSDKFTKAMSATADKATLYFADEGFLPLDTEKEGSASGFQPDKAAASAAHNPFLAGFYPDHENRILSSTSFFHAVPNFVSDYNAIEEVDDPERIDEILSIMDENANLEKIRDNTGPIADQYGNFVEVPTQFGKDVTRIEKLSFQNKVLIWKKNGQLMGNPNEAARTLYANFGKDGGERIMKLCNQSIAASPLSKYVYMGNVFSSNLYKKTPSAANDGGLVIDIQIDHPNNKVVVTIKTLMKLAAIENPEKQIGQFVLKSSMTIPFDLLTGGSLKGKDSFEAGIHTKEKVSKLVTKSAEAHELLEKF